MTIISNYHVAKGDNFLNTEDLYNERMYYKIGAYPLYGPKPLDLWYDTPLYGKIDHEGDAVFWTGRYADTISKSGASKLMVVPDFIAEAFAAFREEYNTSAMLNPLHDAHSIASLAEITPRKGYVDVHRLYRDHFQNFHDIFSLSFLKEKNREQKMITFDDYLKFFVEAVNEITVSVPITKTGFMLSKYCTNNVSGLIVEIANEMAGNDYVKHAKFIKNGSFNMYRNYARKHGFLLDKNAPWRLIADITTPEMKKYMSFAGTSTDDIFDKYYKKIHHTDIESLKTELYEFYRQYVAVYPNFQKVTPTKNSTVVCLVTRHTLRKTEFEKKYDMNFWLKLYLHLRVKESKINMGQAQFDKKVRRAQKLFQYKGFTSAVDYINMEVRRFTERVYIGEGEKPGGYKLTL